MRQKPNTRLRDLPKSKKAKTHKLSELSKTEQNWLAKLNGMLDELRCEDNVQNNRLATWLTEAEYEGFESDLERTHISWPASHSSNEAGRRWGKYQSYSIHNRPRHPATGRNLCGYSRQETPCQEGYCSDRSEQSVKVKSTTDGLKKYNKI